MTGRGRLLTRSRDGCATGESCAAALMAFLGASFGGRERNYQRETQFHHILDHDLKIIRANLKLDLAPEGHVGHVMRGLTQGKLHLHLLQHGGLVRRDKPRRLPEFADRRQPSG